MAVMNRRHALFALAATPLFGSHTGAEVPRPYKVSMLSGGQEGDKWQAGVLIELEPGWKTYWRVPGDTGIPPQFDWAGSKNADVVEVGYPVPTRFQDAGGESIGYHDKVMFPFMVKPVKPGEMVHLQLGMFFAVCKEICIPATVKAELLFNSSVVNPELNNWQKRVPRVVAIGEAPIVTNVRIEKTQGKSMLALNLAKPAQDIFIESETAAYFGMPRFDVAPGEAWLPVWNLKDTEKLRGIPLKVTLSFGDSGVEQKLVIN